MDARQDKTPRSTGILPVDPDLSIDQAVILAQETQQDLLGFENAGNQWLAVHRDDLIKMESMGLEALPVSCIAISENSALLIGGRSLQETAHDYSRRLTTYLPVYFVAALYELQSLIVRQNIKAYVIGGIVRDLLQFKERRLSVEDVDITVEGDALALATFLTENSRNFVLLEAYPEFGTVKLRYKDSLMFDIASTRQEIYPSCGALPVVVKRGVPLIDDVIRRDFSINALAFSVHELGQVLDYANGIPDIRERKLRVLHPVSFFEDPSRVLRALKFCARFDFELAEETHQLLVQFLDLAHSGGYDGYRGGGERIKQELKGLFSVPESDAKTRWIRFFMETGCYRLLLMDTTMALSQQSLTWIKAASHRLPELQSWLANYIDRDFQFDIYLCFLFAEWPEETFKLAAGRLGLTKNEREFVDHFRANRFTACQKLSTLHEGTSPVETYDLFKHQPFISVVACLIAIGIENEPQMKIVLEAYQIFKRKWDKLELELDGNDLMILGVPKGRLLGHLLRRLLHAKLAGQVMDRQDEINFVHGYLEDLSPEPEEDWLNPLEVPAPRTQYATSPFPVKAQEGTPDVLPS